MISALNPYKSKKKQLGLHLSKNVLSVCLLSNENGKIDVNWITQFTEANHLAKKKEIISEIKKHGARGAECHTVLSTQNRDIFQIPPPNTSPDEYNQSVRWIVKDYVDFPVDEMVIDTFDLAKDDNARSKPQLTVVVAKKKEIIQMQELVSALGLKRGTVTIPEMSLRNLLSFTPNAKSTLLSIAPFGKRWLLSIQRDDEIFLLRQLTGITSAPSVKERLSHLELELQRSLDYFEVRMGQTPVSQILVFQDSRLSPIPIEQLEKALTVPVANVRPHELFTIHEDVSFNEDLYLALGGALERYVCEENGHG